MQVIRTIGGVGQVFLSRDNTERWNATMSLAEKFTDNVHDVYAMNDHINHLFKGYENRLSEFRAGPLDRQYVSHPDLGFNGTLGIGSARCLVVNLGIPQALGGNRPDYFYDNGARLTLVESLDGIKKPASTFVSLLYKPGKASDLKDDIVSYLGQRVGLSGALPIPRPNGSLVFGIPTPHRFDELRQLYRVAETMIEEVPGLKLALPERGDGVSNRNSTQYWSSIADFVNKFPDLVWEKLNYLPEF